ncbi:hypothetical protein ILUMI_21310 [Ignelater luminosus]|uniref:Uncharacterized protein n=1 Tax=Ignelater luminosus TaxID=2038154 RepID=A0A8K0G401_IGNLU|nr:hypothetical protein ILUMI_21310 [Ignelater luminosus]
MSNSESENDVPRKKRTKGIVNASAYKRNIIKTSRVKGKEYVSHSGKQVPVVKTGDDYVLKYFLSLESKNIQDTFLQNLIEKKKVNTRRKKATDRNRNGLSEDENIEEVGQNNSQQDFWKVSFFDYFVKFNGKRFKVYKKAFVSLHVKKQYLDDRLNVKSNVQNFYDNPDLKVISLDVLKSTFARLAKLSVKLKDALLCDNSKKAVVAEMMVHKQKARKFYTAMKDAQENQNETVAVLHFDYMQNLPLPAIPVQEIF